MRGWALVTAVGCGLAAVAGQAATSSKSVQSGMGGNGHNVTFDGRVFIVRQGGNPDGWFANVFRPQQVTRDAENFPRMDQGAFGPFVHIQAPTNGENALAICEPNPDDTPYRCNDQNQRDTNGAFLCYELVIIDSNAEANQENSLYRRELFLRTDPADNPNATLVHFEWRGARELMGPRMRGIEATVSRDGRLLIYQGHPNNNGEIDIIMYTTNDTPCGLTGWATARSLSAMHTDAAASARYRLGERQLRAADGTAYAANSLFRGAYPWLFPDGDALIFASVTVPCRAENDPAGCGPRRGGISVIGYPTNWGLAHVDGAVNPDTDQTVRLFFSSPGPRQFPNLPATPGVDVWPFFGSNTQNYTEIVLDDGLDGQYAGNWHMNENVTVTGTMDNRKVPDSSGYFGTGTLNGGAVLPARNNGVVGKALELNGSDGWMRVENSTALNPVNALTVEMHVFPAAPVDCDANNNWRVLLQKGSVGQGVTSLVLEEGETMQARVQSGGAERAIWANGAIPVGQSSHVAYTFDGATGAMAFFINGVETNRVTHPAGVINGNISPIFIGGSGSNRGACPDGAGSFQGKLDEVKISRVVRYGAVAPPVDAGVPQSSSAAPPASSASQGASSTGTASSVGTASSMGTASSQGVASSAGGSGGSSAGSRASSASRTGSSSGGGMVSSTGSGGTIGRPDAGTPDAGSSEPPTTCASTHVSGGIPLAGLVLAAAVWRSRRRRD